jgi:homoserine dehydrogenase
MRADLALVGYGNVARRFEGLLAEQADVLERQHGLTCRVVATSTLRHGSVAGGKPCNGAFEAIEHLSASGADLRVVVETTTLNVQNAEPAISHVRAAIRAGCHIVTANKGPVAFAYDELSADACRAGVGFLFEGAVMDGVPIFNLVRETLPAVTITGFEGVINTTTNHIITAMERGESFDAALAKMQADGIAEQDASLDVDGWDAAAKTAALANVLLKARITPHDVDRTGINAGTGAAARAALDSAKRLKLVASARRQGERVTASVKARELPAASLLGSLAGEANALIIETDLVNRIAICQLSSSLTQTAYALLSDLISLSRTYGPKAPRT